MSFVGKLEDLAAPDLLSAVSNGRKTGKLTVTRPDGYVVLVFRAGSIIYASSDFARETLGGLLVAAGKIADDTLVEALELQHRFKETRRLGRILLDMGAVEPTALHEALRQQSETVLRELFTWTTGFFKFELIESPEDGNERIDVEVDLSDLLLQEGLATQEVMLEVMRQLDEAARKKPGEEEPLPEIEVIPIEAPSLDRLDAERLLELMSDIRASNSTVEISEILMKGARDRLQRGAFFLPRGQEIRGMSQFGIGKTEAAGTKKVKSLRVAMDPPSTLSEVATSRHTFQGALESNYWNEYLVRELGGEVPSESAVFPVVVGNSCALLLYGDNLPSQDPLPSLVDLEILFFYAGLAIERMMLERRLKGEV